MMINRNSFLILILFASYTLSFGQLSLNVNGGGNLTDYKFNNSDNIETEPNIQYFVGLAPHYKLSDKLALNLDLNFALKGFKIKETNDPQFRFSYLDVIPEIEYKLTSVLGIGVGVFYSYKLKEEFTDLNGDWETVRDEVETLEPSDFGVSGKIKISILNFYGFARYNLGLANVNKVDFTDINGSTITGIEQKSSVLQIGVGLKLF